MRKELTHCGLKGPCTPFQGAVQKVGVAEGAKRRVSSAGLCGAGRSNGYSLRTKKGTTRDITNPAGFMVSASQRLLGS
jgi:hypothetical protein